MQSAGAYASVLRREAQQYKPVVLCVDDEKSVLDTIEEQIRSVIGKHFRIELAESGEEALEIIEECLSQKRPIGVIISDQLMPGMKGDELLIKAHELVPRARKIMLTGQAALEDVTRVINKAELFRYIAKPWEINDFQLTVQEAAKSYLTETTVEEQNRILKLLYQTSKRWLESRDADESALQLCDAILQLTAADRCLLFLQKDQIFYLVVEGDASTLSLLPEPPRLDTLDAEHYPLRALKAATKAEKITHLDGIPDPYFQKQQIASAISVPLYSLGRLVGMLYLEKTQIENYFNEPLKELIELLSSMGGATLQLLHLYDELERVALNASKERIASDSQKEEMVRIVSHDIRSPLTGIYNLSQMLQDPDIASDSKQIQEFGKIIAQSAQTILKLVNDILDLAKLESGKIVFNKSLHKVSEIFKKVVEIFQPNVITKNIRLTTQIEEDVAVEVDFTKLLQAIGNFVSNAIKFTPEGGEIRLIATKVQHEGKPYLKIAIQDTGIGIEPDKLDKIFEKFSSHQRSGTAGEKGTGLGLSIAREIILQHGGFITVESEPGKGTTFNVHLPL